MPIRLEIHADNVQEFDTLLARFAFRSPIAAIMSEIAHTPAAQEAAPKGNARSRKTKTEEQSSEGSTNSNASSTGSTNSNASSTGSVVAGATATTTAAAPTTEAAPVDPFAAPETTATPAATSPADQAVAEAGEVTIQQLKDAMADLLKAKSASFAMQTLEQATGCKSLTSGSPNVVEKAKDDPSIMRRTLDALVVAKNAV